jgi:DNA-binding CsgD family transcriptional regulator
MTDGASWATITLTMHETSAQPSLPVAPAPGRLLQSVPPIPAEPCEPGHPPLGALADLATTSSADVAKLARAALTPALPHDALILVTSRAPALPVQIASPRSLQERLAPIDWCRITDTRAPAEGTATRLPLADTLAGLKVAAWCAQSGPVTVKLVVAAHERLDIEPAAERAAMLICMLAAARVRGIDADPPPGTLAFSRTVSQERERVRAELNSRHAATLSTVLRTLRAATGAGGARSAPPEVSEAIDVASRALLDLEAADTGQDEAERTLVGTAFAHAEREARAIVHAARLRVIADIDAPPGVSVAYAIGQAARVVTCAAALNATHRAGADKLRVLWKLGDDALTVTVADNGGDFQPGEPQAQLAGIERRLAGLNGRIELDASPQWGITLTCRLPLYDVAAAPETAAAKRLAELRDREREVLELMIAGLRNRDIAERLFISVRTVKFHVSNILQKLDVDSRTAAIAMAHSAGISAPAAPEPALTPIAAAG